MQKTLDVIAAKRVVLDHLATGAKVNACMLKVNRSRETYRKWMADDAEFKKAVQEIRSALAKGEKAKTSVPDFPEFCEKYLNMPLPTHHLRAWDVVQGHEPRDFLPCMQYQAGKNPGRYLMMNFPPDHAKSTVWNVQYALWRIVKDPNIRIITVSKSQGMAKKFLRQIKFYLANANLYPALHAAFAPEGGWKNEDKSSGDAWRDDMIYVKGRDVAEKDPTVQALGIGGQIYGARADLILLDDIADIQTASDYEKQADWIGQEVFSRLDKQHGQLMILGTRVGAVDIYRWLRDEAKSAGRPFYTYFAQPAILENSTGPTEDWVVLWPERIDAEAIEDAKAAMTDPRRFSFVYQQEDVNEFSVFPPNQVEASVNARRFAGLMVKEGLEGWAPGHRERGMEGMYVVGSWDPASSSGRNAFIIGAVERGSSKRWILDVWNKKGVTSAVTIPKLKELTLKYKVNQWVVEKNAVQQFITQLPEIRNFLSANGSVLKEHTTTSNKFDPSMGIEGTLVPLFQSCVDPESGRALPDGHGLIELPSRRMGPGQNVHVHELCEQLKAWEPKNDKIVQDLVMALWFCELGMRNYLRGAQGDNTHLPGRFTSRRGVRSRVVIPFEEAAAKGMLHAV
ncbi:hypothetical protein [Lentzea sp. NBRC 102530]|uniref:hypothetical protein n=1 Tax=Lentzea sp. NBRC 102530 TaxID=3032201 RepID=UPI002552E21F|nr:hypothetical protein [Lentzea sp. NBRC 102530]